MSSIEYSHLHFVRAYKEKKRWFIDDDNGFSKSENMLVSGIPEIIEAIIGHNASKIEIQYSDVHFENSYKLCRQSMNNNGSIYSCTLNGKNLTGWLCPVFFYYYQVPPVELYVNIKEVDV